GGAAAGARVGGAAARLRLAVLVGRLPAVATTRRRPGPLVQPARGAHAGERPGRPWSRRVGRRLAPPDRSTRTGTARGADECGGGTVVLRGPPSPRDAGTFPVGPARRAHAVGSRLRRAGREQPAAEVAGRGACRRRRRRVGCRARAGPSPVTG